MDIIKKVEDILKDIKNGKMIIVTDDEDRENEGDLICAAEVTSYDAVNFMTKYGRGLICIPIAEERGKVLQLHDMALENTDSHSTAFTVSVDSVKTTTGISIQDRLDTILDMADEKIGAEGFKKPGHMFPLIAKKNGVIERPGHTEAAVDLAKLAGLKPAGVICEILKDDGTMARYDDLVKFAKKHELKMLTIKELIEYRKVTEKLVEREVEAKLPTKFGNFRVVAYKNKMDNLEHLAIVKGDVKDKENFLIRLHSECLTADIFASQRCDCGLQLEKALKSIEDEGCGAVLYLRQEGRGIGLYNKLRAYNLQDEGFDTVEANHQLGFGADERDYAIAAQMIKDLQVKSVNIMTNNPRKIEGLEKYGVSVENRKQHEIEAGENNRSYLKTKKEKLGHFINQEI